MSWQDDRILEFQSRPSNLSHSQRSSRRISWKDKSSRGNSLASSIPPSYGEDSEYQYDDERSQGTVCACSCCNSLCSKRGVLKLMEVLLTLLVLICIAISQATSSGVTSSYSMGMGTNIFNSFDSSPFQGVELERANELDRLFSQMRAPATYGGVIMTVMIFCGTLGMLVSSVDQKRKDSRVWILADLVFSSICASICIVGLGLYLHVIISANATDVCLQRQRLYGGRGQTWVNCQVQGTDGAAAFFIVLLALLYIASAVVAARNLIKVHKGRRTACNLSACSPALFDKPPSYTSTALNDIESDVTLSQYVPPPREGGVQPSAAHKPRKCKREDDLYI